MTDREKLLHRLELRKQLSHSISHIPSLPSPPLYYNHVTNQISDDDPLLSYLSSDRYPDDLLMNWRCGSLNIPRNLTMRLIRMPEKHQYALLRSNGGDGTACGKLWAPALVFPLILADDTTIIYKNVYDWIYDCNVLEVGAGWAGTPSLTAYRMGAKHVAITDGEDVMVQCANVNIAAEMAAYSIRPKGSLSAHVFRWGNQSDATAILQQLEINSFDCIIGCDCIYDTTTVMNLFNSIVNNFQCSRVIFCWETRDHRYDAEEVFFQQLLFQYSFRIKYFTSTLLSDLSYHTNSPDIKLCCDEIRSYLDSSQSCSLSPPPAQHKPSSYHEKHDERNDINFLLAERWIPPPNSPYNSPMKAQERERMLKSLLSQSEEKNELKDDCNLLKKESKKSEYRDFDEEVEDDEEEVKASIKEGIRK